MIVKKYHAKDMQQAMESVRRELGSDAVILDSRKVRKKGLKNLLKNKILEVTVAYDPAKTPAAKKFTLPRSQAPQPEPEQKKPENPVEESPERALEKLLEKLPEIKPETQLKVQPQKAPEKPPASAELERLDKRIDSLDSMLSDFVNKFSYVKREITHDYPEEIQEILCKMIENEVKEELAHILAKEAEQMLRKQSGANAAEVMEHLVHEKLGRAEPILHKKFAQKIILFFGPTGVGKTTSIAKLATDFSVQQKKNIGIINTDTFRIGAQEQLSTYAEILGLPIQVIYDMKDLKGAIDNMADRDVIFIDTAGKRPGDEQHKEDILEIVRIAKPEDVLLCISASTSFATIKDTVDAYKFVDDYRLLVTKLDETNYRGALLNICWYTQKPMAYITTGQNVPDDIETVNVDAIAKEIVGNGKARGAAVNKV